MKFTVAVCTWNRAGLLDRTLSAMRFIRVPGGVEWELLVVNNNCTDDTDDVIARHGSQLPLRRLFEAKPGQSNARNCAVEAARGELLVWTDDDVVVDPDWLTAYAAAAKRWPNADFFGGAVVPWFEIRPPGWALASLELDTSGKERTLPDGLSLPAPGMNGMFALRDFGPEERLFSVQEQPYGANMAFRLEALRRFRFDPELGLVRDSQIRGDENTVLKPMRSQGALGVWVPSSKVRHFIPSCRLTKKYLWDYFHGSGRAATRISGELLQGVTFLGAPRWLYMQMAKSWLSSYYCRLLSRTSWVAPYAWAAFYSGVIKEHRHQSLVGRTTRELSQSVRSDA